MAISAAPLRNGQICFNEADTINGSHWGTVATTAGNGSLSIVADPDSATGRMVLLSETDSGGDTNWAYNRVPLQYLNNGATTVTTEYGSFKMLVQLYLTAAYTIGNTNEIAAIRILSGGNIATNTTLTIRLEGSSIGTNAIQFDVATNNSAHNNVDSKGHGHDGAYQYDIGCYGSWVTLLIEYQKGTGADGQLYISWEAGRQNTMSRGTILSEGTGNCWAITDLDGTEDFNQFALGCRLSGAYGQTNLYYGDIAWTSAATLAGCDTPTIIPYPLAGLVRDVSHDTACFFIRTPPGAHKSNWHGDGACRASLRYRELDSSDSYTETDKITLDATNYYGGCIKIESLSTDIEALVRIYDEINDGDYIDLTHKLEARLLPSTLTSTKFMVTHCYSEEGLAHPYYSFGHDDYDYIIYHDDIGYFDVYYAGNYADSDAVEEVAYKSYFHALMDYYLVTKNRTTPMFCFWGDHQIVDDMRLSYRTSTGIPGGWSTVTYADVWTGCKAAWDAWFTAGMIGILESGEIYRVIGSGDVVIGLPDDVTLRDVGSTIYGTTQHGHFDTAEAALTGHPWYLWGSGRWTAASADYYYEDDPAYPSYSDDVSTRESSWTTNQLNTIVISKDRHYIECNTNSSAAVFEVTNGPGAYNQWTIDLTGEVSGNAKYQYTPNTTAAYWMRAFTVLTLTPTSANVESFKEEEGTISSLGSYTASKMYIASGGGGRITDSNNNIPGLGLGVL